MLFVYILWDDWPIFMISDSNEQLQQQLEYTLLKPDCYSWWISKKQTGREDTLEERYEIKFSFKLGKIPQKRMECFRLLLDHLAWIEHQFLRSIRDSRKAGSLWGMMRGVGGVRKSEHQSWLAKGLGLVLELLCWGFKGVKEEISSEEARTLQIGSVVFPAGQCTHQSITPSLSQTIWSRWASTQILTLPIVQTLLPVTFGFFPKLRGCCYENWGDERGCDEGHWHAHTRSLPWGLAEVVGMVQKVNCSRRRLLRRGLEFHVCILNKSAQTDKVWKLI